jgi:hypothetical protein
MTHRVRLLSVCSRGSEDCRSSAAAASIRISKNTKQQHGAHVKEEVGRVTEKWCPSALTSLPPALTTASDACPQATPTCPLHNYANRDQDF